MYQLLRLEVLYHGYYKVSRHAVPTLLAACNKRSLCTYCLLPPHRMALGCSLSLAGQYRDRVNLLAASFTRFLPSLRKNHVRRCHRHSHRTADEVSQSGHGNCILPIGFMLPGQTL